MATLCAEAVRNAFLDYEARFREITQGARDRFLTRDWHGSDNDAAERLRLYSRVLDDVSSEIQELMGSRLRERAVWAAIKAVYSSLIAQSTRWEIGESFFNSLTRRVFATEGVDQAIEFVDTDFDAPPTTAATNVFRSYSGDSLPELLFRLLTDESVGGFARTAGTISAQRRDLAAEHSGRNILGRSRSVSDRDLRVRYFIAGTGAYFSWLRVTAMELMMRRPPSHSVYASR